MGTPVHVEKTYTGTGEQAPIPLNRWSRPSTSLVVKLNTTGTYTVEATLTQLNRSTAGTPIWFELTDLVALETDITDTLKDTPLEAIRLNIAVNGSSIFFQVLQSGESH